MWPEGTVALGTVTNFREPVHHVILLSGHGTAEPKQRWVTTDRRVVNAETESDGWFFDFQVSDVHPLVVIDAENRDQVMAVGFKLQEATGHGEFGYMTAQRFLRSLQPALKPSEPDGIGAVVQITHDGTLWIRRGRVHWIAAEGRRLGEVLTWAELPDDLTILATGIPEGEED